jgi:hypothetical protein
MSSSTASAGRRQRYAVVDPPCSSSRESTHKQPEKGGNESKKAEIEKARVSLQRMLMLEESKQGGVRGSKSEQGKVRGSEGKQSSTELGLAVATQLVVPGVAGLSLKLSDDFRGRIARRFEAETKESNEQVEKTPDAVVFL